MAIDKDTVRYVAHLARVRLNDKELDLLSGQLQDIVHFIDKLKELKVEGIKPTSHVLPVKNVFREDKSAQSLNVEDTLSNALMQKENYFIVPKVIE